MFNTEKLSIEQFNDIKQKLTKVLEDASLEESANENNPDFDMMEFLKQFSEQYLVYQNSLFNYDLSDIPFEAWEDVNLLTSEDFHDDGLDIDINIDFSKTRANLDFSLVGIYGKGNFKGCNVRNIQCFNYISEEFFDEHVINDNSDIFLSSSFSFDFKNKFYSNKTKIEDFVDLSSEQLLEIKQNKCYEFSKVHNETNFLGLERCIELYKNFPNDYYEVVENLCGSLEFSNDKSQYYFQLFDCNLADLKNVSFNYLRESLIKSTYGIDLKQYSSRILKSNEDIFLPQLYKSVISKYYKNGKISQEEAKKLFILSDKYYEKKLSIYDVYNYFELFEGVDLTSFFVNDEVKSACENIGSDNFKKILIDHFDEIEWLVQANYMSDFVVYFQKSLDCFDFETKYANSIRFVIKDKLFRNYHKKFHDTSDLEYIPQYFINHFNFNFIIKYKSFHEIVNFDNKTIILDEYQAKVFYHFGLNHILEFQKNTGYFNEDPDFDFNSKLHNLFNPFVDFTDYNTIYEYLFACKDRLLYSFDLELLKSNFSEKQIQYLLFSKENDNYFQKLKLTSEQIEDFFDANGVILNKLCDFLFFDGCFDYLLNLSVNLYDSNFDDKKIKVLDVYKNINPNIKPIFKDYILNNFDVITIDKIDLISDLLIRISSSNSSEIVNFQTEIANQLLNTDDPINNFDKIEEVFIKNNLPTVGKIYNVFQILHPDCEGFDFSDFSKVSPVLQSKSVRGRNAIIFADLLKASFGSNNRSIKEYLDNIEQGDFLFRQISSDQITYDQLDDKNKQILFVFLQHLNTLYNNTKLNKNNEIVLTGNIIDDINVFRKLFSKDGSIDYDLPDRIVRMFGHFAGFDNFNDAKEYFNLKVKKADLKNRDFSRKEIKLEQGDYIKGITDIKYLSNILQNGSVAKEFLGDSATSDFTPLDTDLSKVMVHGDSINDIISKTEANGYGPILFVLKNDDRFSVTRVGSNESNKMIDTKYDSSKLEIFYTGAVGDGHYGIRTGFASSEIDYMIVNQNDHRVNLEIAKNGFYIPVVDRKTGKLIFTPEDYDILRSKMSGLSYYDSNEFSFSDKLLSPDIKELASQISDSEKDVLDKRTAINNAIREAISSIGLELKTTIDGDLTPGSIELIDTGSTGRGTNMPGDGDFDFMIRVDKIVLDDKDKFNQFKEVLLNKFKDNNNSLITGNGDFRLKGVQVSGLEVPVDIDISFVQKTNKLNYSTDMSLRDRLDTIRKQDPENYNLVVANILVAKKTLKEAGVYKPNCGEVPQGGLGGVGIENWILQNGGSFEDAARSFIECANGKSFEQFKEEYFIWNFGENHFAVRNGDYPHNNFVVNNMSEIGYEKMQEVLKNYLNKLKQNENVDYMIEEMINGVIDVDGNSIVSNQEVNINRMGFGTLTVLGIFSLLASCLILVLGVLLSL